jgi:drug/metabolite transporter (DMT)-like permease
VIWANLSALLGAILSGLALTAIRAVSADVGPMTLLVLRFAQGGLAIWLTLTALGRWPRLRRDQLGLLLAMSGAGACSLALLHFGLIFTEASRGALMWATSPIWAALIAWRFECEALEPRRIAGILSSCLGIAVCLAARRMEQGTPTLALLGDAIVVVAAVAMALTMTLIRRARRHHDSAVVTGFGMLAGAVLFLPLTLTENPFDITWDAATVGLVVFLGLPAGAVSYVLWNFSVARLSATGTLTYMNLTMPIGALAGALFLGETIGAVFVLGTICVIGGIVLVNRRPPRTAGGNQQGSG